MAAKVKIPEKAKAKVRTQKDLARKEPIDIPKKNVKRVKPKEEPVVEVTPDEEVQPPLLVVERFDPPSNRISFSELFKK